MKPVHWVALATGALAALYFGSRIIGGGKTGGFNAPPKQPVPEDDLHDMLNPHPEHPVICHRDSHHHGYVYTPHRYPRVSGGEITAVIHRGFSTMRVPDVADVQWMIAPPSEVQF